MAFLLLHNYTDFIKINLITLLGTHFDVTEIEDSSVVKIYNIKTLI